MSDRNVEMARRIAARAAEEGGRVYFVGGYVRDLLQGCPGKDVDIEVHGLRPEALAAILDSLGERTVMGASFGIYGLRHYDLDIAMPRSERATGRGHKDFEVFVDPFIGTERAARRRDFTINAMMQDVLTGEVIDPFGGRRDLAAGILRHVNDESFAEDPLRVLRGAQFSARFGFPLAPETADLCARMDLTALAKERVFTEMEKALLKAERPSRFFTVLREIGQLEPWFPEVRALIGVPQEERFHPEGDVWTHTMGVVDAAAGLRDRAEHPRALLLAALCHDLGKAVTTEETGGRIRSIGHERAGVPLTAAFLERLTGEKELCRQVENLVRLHMRPLRLPADGARKKSYMKLYDEAFCPRDLLLLAEADRLGTGLPAAPVMLTLLRQRLADYEALMREPEVRGADLIAAGLRPGPDFSETLAYTHRLHLSGIPRERALAEALRLHGDRAAKAPEERTP